MQFENLVLVMTGVSDNVRSEQQGAVGDVVMAMQRPGGGGGRNPGKTA